MKHTVSHITQKHGVGMDSSGNGNCPLVMAHHIDGTHEALNTWNIDSHSNTLTPSRDTKRSKSLNNESVSTNLVDNAVVRRRTSSESDDPICLRNGIVARNKRLGTSRHEENVNLDSVERSNMIEELNKLTNIGVENYNSEKDVENRTANESDKETLLNRNVVENGSNLVTWKSLSPKQSYKALSGVSSPESSESDTVIENKLGVLNTDGTKMSCDSPVTFSSSTSSSPLQRSKIRSEKNSVASSEETFNNSYFYDEDFQVQFDTNIRERQLDVQTDSILDFSDAFSDELTTGSFPSDEKDKCGELSSGETSVVSSTAMTCSSDAIQLSTGPLFAATPYYDGPVHNFSTDSLDHERYVLTASVDAEAINLDCKPKKENYMLSFSGYSDKRGTSDGSIDSDSSSSSFAISNVAINNHNISDPMLFDSPPSRSSSNNTSAKDSDSSQRRLINKWATRRNLISPSISQGDCRYSHETSRSSGSLTCWNNIKPTVLQPQEQTSVPKSSSLEEFHKTSPNYGDTDGGKSNTSSPVPTSLLDIYRHSHGESSYEDALEEIDTSDYVELVNGDKMKTYSLGNSSDLEGIKTISRCQSVPEQCCDSSHVPRSRYQRSLSSPTGNWRQCQTFGYKNEVPTQFPSTHDTFDFIPWSGTRNFSAQFPPNTKECGIQTSMISSSESKTCTRPPPRSQSCPQNLSTEFDDFLSQHLMHRSQSLIRWIPMNAESVYRNVFECQSPFIGGIRKRGCSSSPMRPVKSSFYSHHCHKSLPDLTFLEVPLNPEHLKQTESRIRTKTKSQQLQPPFVPKPRCHSPNFSYPRLLQTRSKSTGSLPDKMNIRGPIPPKSSNTTRNNGKLRPQDLASSSGASSSSSGIDPGYYDYSMPLNYHNLYYKHRPTSMNSFNSGCTHYEIPPMQVMCCCGGNECNNLLYMQQKADTQKAYAVPKQKLNTAVGQSASLGDLYAVNEEATPTTTPDSTGKDLNCEFAKENIRICEDVKRDDGVQTTDTDAKNDATSDEKSSSSDKPLKSCLRKNRQDFANARRCQSICGPLQRDDGHQHWSHPSKQTHRHSYAFDVKSDSNDDFTWMLNHALEIPGELRCATDSRDLILNSVHAFQDGCPDDLAGSKFTLSSSGGGNTSDDSEKKEKRKSVSFASEISVHKTVDSPHTQDEISNNGAGSDTTSTSEQGTRSDGPPDNFMAASPLTSVILTPEEHQARKTGYLNDISAASKCLVAHFAKGRQAYDKLRLGNLTETPELGHIVLSRLCPAVARVISDGLRGHVSGVAVMGRVSLSAWRVAEVSVELGTGNGAMCDLIKELRNRPDLVSTRQRFEAFIFGLLNLRMLDGWLCQVREKESIMLRFYEPTALMCVSHDQLLEPYEDMIMSLQLLTVLPFQMDYSFVVSYHTSQLSRDVDDIYLDNKYSHLRTSGQEGQVKTCSTMPATKNPHGTQAREVSKKVDITARMQKCTKDWWRGTEAIPAVVSTVRKHLTPAVEIFQRESKRRWSFTGSIFGMSQSTPANVSGKGQGFYVQEGDEDDEPGTVRVTHRHEILKLTLPMRCVSREMINRRHSDNSDVEKKLPPPKPKRLSKTERELLQSLEEFRMDRGRVAGACVTDDLIDLSDEAVFAEEKRKHEADYVNVPSPEKIKVGQGVERVGQASGKVGDGGKLRHAGEIVAGQNDNSIVDKLGIDEKEGSKEKAGVDKECKAEKVGIMAKLAQEKKVCRVFADKLGKYESGVAKKISQAPDVVVVGTKTLGCGEGKSIKPSKLPVFSPVKRNPSGNVKTVPVKQTVAAKTDVRVGKTVKNTSVKKNVDKSESDNGEKAPSKLIKLFDKIMLPRTRVPDQKTTNRWSWAGAASPSVTASKIPAFKVKSTDRADVKAPMGRNRFGFHSKAVTHTNLVSPKTLPLDHTDRSDDLDVSLCDIAVVKPPVSRYDEIDDTAPTSRDLSHDTQPRQEIDTNANFLDPPSENEAAGFSGNKIDCSVETTWDSFKRPDYKYVKTRADSPGLDDPDCSEMAYERGETLRVLAQLNDDWLYCSDAHREGLVRVHSVRPI